MRQFWSTLAGSSSIVCIAWLLVLCTAEVERYVLRRIPAANAAAATSLLRVVRRAADLLIVFAALLALLRHFGIDPTPALAGLGVGGIAVALAAQKTLENVIAGASLIFDQAVKVGDFLKMGEIGRHRRPHRPALDAHPHARSHGRQRPQQPDRQRHASRRCRRATCSGSTRSCGCATRRPPTQLRAVLDGIRQLLVRASARSIASRCACGSIALGAFSLDVEVFAYVARATGTSSSRSRSSCCSA